MLAVLETPTTVAPPKALSNGTHDAAMLRYPLPLLPTLPWEWGYKVVRNEATGQAVETPLTLLDILYPTGEELFVAEGWNHRWLSVMLEIILRAHLGQLGWVVFGNVFVHFGRPGVPPFAPDVTAVPGGEYPADDGSFIVGRDGPLPSFVIEVTSPHFLDNDIVRKPLDYAALGIAEFLRIDPWSNRNAPWQLTGYRLGAGPFYNEIAPDVEGGLTFQTVGVRFVGIGRETVQVYNILTGERLTPPEDWLQQAQARAEALAEAEARAAEAERRAEVEAQARVEAEARLAEYAELLKKAGLL